MSTSTFFTDIKQAFKRATGTSFDVTWRALTLGARDSVTGWRAKSYADSTIEMVIIPQVASRLAASFGIYVTLDALGLTLTAVGVGDEMKDSDNDYYEVETVMKQKIGNVLYVYKCDLRHQPLHD